jgi:hypothetical protein
VPDAPAPPLPPLPRITPLLIMVIASPVVKLAGTVIAGELVEVLPTTTPELIVTVRSDEPAT